MLKTLFSSTTRVKIITHFVTNPKNRFYLRELARLLDESVNPLRRELIKLTRIGFLNAVPEANQTYYALNGQFPIYPELKGIILKTQGIGDILRRHLKELGPIKYAFIYGSIAENTERATSDIDLMIIGKVDIKVLNSVINKAEDLLKREINYRVFAEQEITQRRKQKDDFITEVWNGKKIMLIGDAHELRRIGK